MKPFQFYNIKSFPILKNGEPIKSSVQRKFCCGDEEVSTSVELTGNIRDLSLETIRIVSAVECNDYGYTFFETDKGTIRVEFTSYKHPVDFLAYLDRSRKIIILPQPKRICKKVFLNLNTIDDVSLEDMEVDFQETHKQNPVYYNAWFRNLSANVNTVGVAGNQIQEDNIFKHLQKTGELSNVTILWQYGGVEHRLMISRDGALILQKAYNDNQMLELTVILDAFDRLLSQAWKPRERRRRAREYDIPTEP
jgi:hypothetical protein